MIDITDANDPRLASYRNIRERDLVGRDGQFIAEGKSVLAVLAQSKRFAIASVLVLENRQNSITEILETLPPNTPVYRVDRATIDALAGFPMHRGIMAIGMRPSACDTPPDLSIAKNWKRIVCLSAIANHDNMGAIFRNAAAFGADAVLMDKASCDPLYRKAIRVSVGGVLTVPFFRFDTANAMLEWTEGAGFSVAALSPSGVTQLHAWQPPAKAALLMGAEGPGLPDAIMASRQTLSIAMAGGFDSLNVGTATGIALHHLLVSQV